MVTPDGIRPPRGVRWLGDTPGDGFGDAATEYISALRAAGVPVTWTPLGDGSWAWVAWAGSTRPATRACPRSASP